MSGEEDWTINSQQAFCDRREMFPGVASTEHRGDSTLRSALTSTPPMLQNPGRMLEVRSWLGMD